MSGTSGCSEVEYPLYKSIAGETELHHMVIMDSYWGLRYWYDETPDVHVDRLIPIYYAEGDPTAVVLSDVVVIQGVAKRDHGTYKLWEEKKAPCMIIEVTSKATRHEDTVTKKAIYEGLGVREYFLYDPDGEYLDPKLQGFRLYTGGYEQLEVRDDSLLSETIGMILSFSRDPYEPQLRLMDIRTGEPLPWLCEWSFDDLGPYTEKRRAFDLRLAEKVKADEERKAAEKENARLRAERDHMTK